MALASLAYSAQREIHISNMVLPTLMLLVAFVSFEAANGLPYGPKNQNTLTADVAQDERIMKRFLEFDKNGDGKVSLAESKAGKLNL